MFDPGGGSFDVSLLTIEDVSDVAGYVWIEDVSVRELKWCALNSRHLRCVGLPFACLLLRSPIQMSRFSFSTDFSRVGKTPPPQSCPPTLIVTNTPDTSERRVAISEVRSLFQSVPRSSQEGGIYYLID